MKNLLLSKTPSGPLIDLGSENPNPILKPDDHPKKFINYAWGSKKVDYIPGSSNENSIEVVEKTPLPSYDSLSEALGILATDGSVTYDPITFKNSNKRAVAFTIKNSSKGISFLVPLALHIGSDFLGLPWGSLENCNTNHSLILPGHGSAIEAKEDFNSKENTDMILQNIPNAGAASWCRSLSIPGLKDIEWDLPSMGIVNLLEDHDWVSYLYLIMDPPGSEDPNFSHLMENAKLWTSTQGLEGNIWTHPTYPTFGTDISLKNPCERGFMLTLATYILPDSPIYILKT